MVIGKANPKVFRPVKDNGENPKHEYYNLVKIEVDKPKPNIRGKAVIIGFCMDREKYVAKCKLDDHLTVNEVGRCGWRFDRAEPKGQIGYWLHDGSRKATDKWGDGQSSTNRD